MKQGSIIDGRYKVEKLLGRGGMGQVFLAHDIALEKTVALKLLLPNSSESVLQRFWVEAKALAGLDHPNILKVHHFGEYGAGRMYLVMDYIDGVSLFETLGDKSAQDFLQVLPIFERICRGLRYAHAHHVLHRDLKPGNVMLARNFEDPVKLVDFGLAKLTDRDYDITHPGGAMGSPPYISPEVIRGEPADERSDIYSLGCVLFHHMTGKIPFTGKTKMAIMMEHLNTLPPLLSDVAGKEYPEDIELFVEKCLRKDANSRFQSMDELMAELERIKIAELEKYEIAGMVAPGSEFVVDELLLSRRKHDDELFVRTIKAAAVVGLVLSFGVATFSYFSRKVEPPNVKVDNVPLTEFMDFAQDSTARSLTKPATRPQFQKGKFRLVNIPYLREPLCQVRGKFTDEEFQAKLEKVRDLRNFEFYRASISEAAMDSFLSVPRTGLAFYDTSVTPGMLDKMAKMPLLKSLKIARAPDFTQGSIKHLSAAPSLLIFDFEPEPGVPYLNLYTDILRLKHLQSVRFYLCKLDRANVETLVRGLDLRMFEMSHCELTPDALDDLPQGKRIHSVTCANAKLTQNQLDQIAKLPNLIRLDLHATNLSDEDLKRFYKCKNLKFFTCNLTRVTETGARVIEASRPGLRMKWRQEEQSYESLL